MKKHTWTVLETTTVLDNLVSLYSTTDWNEIIKDTSKQLNVKVSSIKMGISNMINILSDGQQGMSGHNSKQAIAIESIIYKHSISKKRLLSILS